MKISKLFHTLYAFLMFLPVMVLPLFAININQKEVEPLTAQIEQTQVVDFNQVRSNQYISGSFVGNVMQYETVDVTQFEYHIGHKYLTRLNYELEEGVSLKFRLGNPSYAGYSFYLNSSFNHIDYIGEYVLSPVDFNNDLIYFQSFTTGSLNLTYYDLNVFDLTQMFGLGNEPTIQQFNAWYTEDYYDYTTGRKEILYTGVQDTLSNTDIGSQFLYSLYNPLKDYFNLPNYMNLGGLYDWFLANLFSGYNTPVYFIIFTLMIYWLALSLLWLIFDVLMYVPSMIHKMLDKARME